MVPDFSSTAARLTRLATLLAAMLALTLFGGAAYSGMWWLGLLLFVPAAWSIEKILYYRRILEQDLATLQKAKTRADSMASRASLFETMFASMQEGVVITKADLVPPGPEIVYVNDAFCRISGYVREEILGKSPRMFQGKMTDARTLAAISHALKKCQSFKCELLNYAKDNTPYWIQLSIAPIHDTAGNVTHFASLQTDITEQKLGTERSAQALTQLKRVSLKAEASAKALEESLRLAEEANRAKSNFLANMSHELRTPMNGVLGMAHLLKETPLNLEQQEYVSTINGSAETLLMLLNDILDLSKIEAQALVLERIPFDLRGTVQETMNLLKAQAARKQLQLLADIEDSVPRYIWGDSGRLRQIIANLLSNAVKFTENGYVRIRARCVAAEGRPYLHVEIKDTGIGIETEKLESIFDKFTQADSSVTRRYGGTGLGLAITRQLVALMHGSMGVESTPRFGSTFWFTMPLEAASEQDWQQHADAHPVHQLCALQRKPLKAARALLVEDYAVNLLFAEKLLRRFGLTQIDVAENGLVALQRLEVAEYDIVFMDCQMPELDGYQTTMKIREKEGTSGVHLPIVAMTANAMMGDREKCLKAGMDDYLSKPIRPEQLYTLLQGWFIMPAGDVPIPLTDALPSAPIDVRRLTLFTAGDRQEEKALADIFCMHAVQMMATLEQNNMAGNSAMWKAAAHQLKGAAGNIGAARLHQLCRAAEKGADAPEEEKNLLLDEMRTEIGRISAFFGV